MPNVGDDLLHPKNFLFPSFLIYEPVNQLRL
jgi:hypothetical protein